VSKTLNDEGAVAFDFDAVELLLRESFAPACRRFM
jgi:hypothetical protein